MDEEMDAAIGNHGHHDAARGVLAGLRPALPAATVAFVAMFLAAWIIPMGWLSAICWQLYLDTIHPIFAEPLGNATRLALGIGMGLLAMLAATLIALVLAMPEVRGLWAKRKSADAAMWDDFPAAAAPSLARRRADVHPDAPPVAPINALRDLPPEGLMPSPVTAEEPLDLADMVAVDAPVAAAAAALEPTETAALAALPDPDDMSLGAMVARFEAGLDRRRSGLAAATPANGDDTPALDLALEAALSTLHRMNKSAVG
jgi:hypothetical protein